MATETIDERVERLSKETGGTPSPSGISKSPDDVESELNQDMGYQLSTGPDRVLKRKEAYEQYGLTPPTSISSPGTKALDDEGPVHKYVRPALELGGAMAGGTLGAMAPPPLTGPIGGTLGGTLGFAAGDTLSSLLERLAGERPPMESPAQAVGETAQALKGGGAIELASRGAGKVVGAIGSKVMAPFSKQYEGANKTLDELAQSKGVTLDPHEVIQSRPLALGHKVLENIPFTSGAIQRNELKKLGSLTKEWERVRQSTGTDRRQRMGEIGQTIQDTVERELDRLGVRQGEIRDQARNEILNQAGSPITYRELGEQTQQALTDYHAGRKALENAAWDFAREDIPDARVVTRALPAAAKEIRKSYENLPSFLDEPMLRQLGDVQGSGNKKYDAIIEQFNKDYPASLQPANEKIASKLKADRDAALAAALKGEQPGWRVDDLLKLRSELSSKIQEHHTGLQRGNAQAGSADAYGRTYTQLLKAVDEDLAAFGERQGSDLAQRFQVARAASGERMAFFNPKEHPAVAKAIAADPAKLSETLIRPGSAEGYLELQRLVGPTASDPVKRSFTNKLLGVGGPEAEGLGTLRRRLDQYGAQTMAEVYSPQEVRDLYHLADQSRWMKQSPIGNPFFRELVKTNPERVAPVILGHPDLTSKVLRRFPQTRDSLRMAFVEGLSHKANLPFPTKMLQGLNAYPPGVQSQLFSKQELKDFYDLANIVERTQGTVKLAENPSGTAQNLVTFSTGGAILKHPITMAPTVLTTSMITKLYLSKLGRKFLLEGLVTPTSSSRSTYITSQILGVAGVDAVRDAQEQSSRSHGLYRSASPQLEQQP